MIEITINDLASKVAALMGESLLLECTPEESPFPSLEDSVRILAPEILSGLLLEAPVESILECGKKIGTPIEIDSEGAATLRCPDDFLRLVCIKMSDWKCPATELSSLSSPLFRMQGSRWHGIRGTPERPLAFLCPGAEGRELRLFSSGKDAELEEGLYIPAVKIDSADSISFPDCLWLPLLCKLKDSLQT